MIASELAVPFSASGAAAAAPAPGGYLGAELDDESGHGVRVKSVKAGTPAEVSGLRKSVRERGSKPPVRKTAQGERARGEGRKNRRRRS